MKSKLTPKPLKSVSEYIEDIKKKNRLRSGSKEKPQPTITISREFGCAGFPLARTIINKLSTTQAPWEMYSRDLIHAISDEADLSLEVDFSDDREERNTLYQDLQELLNVGESDFTRYKTLAQNVRIIGEQGRAVIVGSGASMLANKEENFFHVRITGSHDFRVRRIAEELGLSRYEAEKTVSEKSSERVAFTQKFSRHKVDDPALYHLILRNDHYETEAMADVIIEAMKQTDLL